MASSHERSTVVETGEKLAERLGLTLEEISEILAEEVEPEPEEVASDIIESVANSKDTDADNDADNDAETDKWPAQCSACGEMFEKMQAFNGHLSNCSGHPVTPTDTAMSDFMAEADDTDAGDDTDNGKIHFPYDNTAEDYDDEMHPNMTKAEIVNHPKFPRMGKTAKALQHHQIKHGVCEDCNIGYCGIAESDIKCPDCLD